MQKLIKDVVQAAYAAYKKTSAFGSTEQLRAVVKDTSSPALILFLALRRLLGPDWTSWEPETLWMELDVPVSNRDKILAAQSLATYPVFYWDYRVFGQTALAFNHQAVYPENVPEPEPEHLAWCVFEAELILALIEEKSFEPTFSDEVEAFVASCLHHKGIVLPPENLSFSEEHLDKMLTSEAKELKSKVKDAWKAHPEANFEDSPLGVQIARQSDIENVYLVNRLTDLRERLTSFSA